MMSRKHYVAIADVLKCCTSPLSYDVQRSIIATRLADVFERENPAFDRARFMHASNARETVVPPCEVEYVGRPASLADRDNARRNYPHTWRNS